MIPRPSAAQVAELAAREHLHVDGDAAARLADLVAEVLEMIDELAPPPREVLHGPRDAGRAPTAGEDPVNAFVRVFDIPGRSGGPLAGLRGAVKDNIAVAGVPLTNGSDMTPYVPAADAVVVERLLAAGATIVGTLNMDAWAAGVTGVTSAFGPARNPHDQTRSAGGSSSGSGAALAAGLADITLGVDQGGSARIPAAFCGVVAAKPTAGLVPSHGVTHVDQRWTAVPDGGQRGSPPVCSTQSPATTTATRSGRARRRGRRAPPISSTPAWPASPSVWSPRRSARSCASRRSSPRHAPSAMRCARPAPMSRRSPCRCGATRARSPWPCGAS